MGSPVYHGTNGNPKFPMDIHWQHWTSLYSGTGWTGGMAAPAMGHWYSPMGSPCPMVQWDGMDRWDGCPSHGTLVQSHGIPLSHGTVGRDGQVGWLPQPWDIGTVPWDPLVPWYSGTGWTGGMGLWYSPMGSPCPMVQWDVMDRWDGKVVQSHGIPCVPWDKWESQIPNGHSLATLDITPQITVLHRLPLLYIPLWASTVHLHHHLPLLSLPLWASTLHICHHLPLLSLPLRTATLHICQPSTSITIFLSSLSPFGPQPSTSATIFLSSLYPYGPQLSTSATIFLSSLYPYGPQPTTSATTFLSNFYITLNFSLHYPPYRTMQHISSLPCNFQFTPALIPALQFPVHPCTHPCPAISSSPLHSSLHCNFQLTPALIPALTLLNINTCI